LYCQLHALGSVYVSNPKILSTHPAAELGRKHGGPFALVDGALQVRLCQVGVGTRRDSLEGCRAAALVHAVSEMPQEVLAQGFEGGAYTAGASRVDERVEKV
jgi:hypothetical protein